MNYCASSDDVICILSNKMMWTQWVFTAFNVVSLPLYVLIMVVCFKEYKYNHLQRTFYLLIICQGVIDITVMVAYFFFGTIRHSMVLSQFFWTYQSYYVASWCFTQIYVTVILRCFGVLLLSFQRYLSVCRHSGRLQRVVNESHRWVLPSLQFTVPIVYSIPLLTITDVSFFAPDLLEVRVDKEKITLATSMTFAFITTTFTLCSLSYGALLKFLVRNRFSNSSSLRRESRLYVQMLGLFAAFALLFVFNLMQFLFSLYYNSGPVFTMRSIFPVISAFLSYVNPWMMMFVNVEIRRKILYSVGLRKTKPSSIARNSTSKVFTTVDVTRMKPTK